MILHDETTIRRYTGSGHWGSRTLIDEFKAHVSLHPERTAIQDPPNRAALLGSSPVTKCWGEVGVAVDAVATGFLQAGLRKDDVVIVQAPNVWELAVLHFAISAAGGIPSPCPMQWTAREVGYVAELTQARFYVAARHFKGSDYLDVAHRLDVAHGQVRYVPMEEIARWALDIPADPDLLSHVPLDPNDIFTLCWTSGTEAMPKGTPLTHNNWFFQTKKILGLSETRDGDCILCAAPIVNMTGVGGMLLQWLFQGGTLILHHPFDMELFLEQLTEHPVDYTILVPAMLTMILKHPDLEELDLSHLRSVATGSAPPSKFALAEFKRRWGIQISNLWGQNEGTALVSGPDDVPDVEMRVSHMPWWGREGVMWRSGVDAIDIKLVRGDGGLAKDPGEIGELAYRGPNLFPGYFRRPDLNTKAFDGEGFFYTGDIFQVVDNAHISFFDRKKDIIIRGGFNISAAEIENVVQAHPDVRDAAAIAVPDDVMGEKVCVCVVPADANNPPTLSALIDWMREQTIAPYKLPEKLRIVERIPRNPIGKVLKSELRQDA